MSKKVELEFHGRPLSIEVGRLAKQADGAALVHSFASLPPTALPAYAGRRPRPVRAHALEGSYLSEAGVRRC